MARRRPRPLVSSPRLILDSGAVIAESRGDPRVRALLRSALARGAILIVPAIVVTETYRADPRDARLNRLLAGVLVPAADLELAKVAGRLLAAATGSNAPDAQVVAEALRYAPSVILTGDPNDIALLAAGHPGVSAVDIGEL